MREIPWTLGDKVKNLRWAFNAMRLRKAYRQLSFGDRQKLLDALRPRLGRGDCIAHPDAIFHVTIDDVIRAYKASNYYGN